tara:strand:- start:808 stop:1551 length:744 start_codon:yes stop_codon:yes gene_type:complete
MGSQNSASSRNAMASGQSGAKKTSIALQADKFAQEQLGIQKTVAGPVQGASSSVTGYMATNTGGNQMYGSLYRQKQGEFLQKAGMGTMSSSGSFVPGVQTDQGLVFTSEARDVYNQTRNQSIPLSKKMFESQQKFKLGVSAVAALAGIPFIPSQLALSSQQPYQEYVNRRESGVFSYQTNTQQNNNKTNQNNNNQKQNNEMFENRFLAKQESDRKKYLASLKTSDAVTGDRKFISSTSRGFGGTYQV